MARYTFRTVKAIIVVAFKLNFTAKMSGSIEILDTTSANVRYFLAIDVLASWRIDAPVSGPEALQYRITKQ